MIKNYKFTVNQDEKRRILDLHESRTSSQYLNLLEQESIEFDEQVETNEGTYTFPTNDPTGKNTVLAKMKELKLDTTNLKDSIKSVITKLGYTL